MELTMIELLSQFGFPAVAFALMYRLYREERSEARDERETWLEAISEHTEAVRDLRHEVRTVATDGGEKDS